MLWSNSPRKLTRVSKTWKSQKLVCLLCQLLEMFQPIVKGKARLRGHCGGTLYTALLVLSDPVGKSKAHSLYEIDIVSHVSSCDLLDVLVTSDWFLSTCVNTFVSCNWYKLRHMWPKKVMQNHTHTPTGEGNSRTKWLWSKWKKSSFYYRALYCQKFTDQCLLYQVDSELTIWVKWVTQIFRKNSLSLFVYQLFPLLAQ